MSLIERWLQRIVDRFDKGINRDETVVFYPAHGVNPGGGADCRIEIQGRITEQNPVLRRLPGIGMTLAGVPDIAGLAALLGDLADEAESLRLFHRRVQNFVLDGESREQFDIDVAGVSVPTERSDRQGFFTARADIPVALLRNQLQADANPWVGFTAFDNDQERIFEGRSQLFQGEGVVVVSDIDDTIKDSNVSDRTQLIINTLFRPFRLTPGMPEIFRSWASRGAGFVYLTSSPYQLYEPLSEFLGRHYPPGAYYMRLIQPADLKQSIAKLFQIDEAMGSRHHAKKLRLVPLLEAFADRKFILVGDSTQSDAEIYVDCFLGENFPEGMTPPANGYSDRIKKIYIRDVRNSKKRNEAKAALDRIGDPSIARFFPARSPDIEQDALSVF